MPKTKDNKDIILDIEVFKKGTHTDANGNVNEWTEEDIDTIIKTYNESIAKDDSLIAPAVKGHPKDNEGALGWVQKLYKVGDKIKALVKIVPSFAEEIKNEAYKKVSISLYDNLMLRHIGFLGAVPPAVKGLENVVLDHSEKDVYFEFADLNNETTSDNPNNTINKVIEDSKPKDFIELKEALKRDKPEIYKEYSAEHFGDPTHFRFPLKSISEVRASLAIFHSPKFIANYTDDEKTVIASRLMRAASTYKINLDPKTWTYNELSIPIESLSKIQLEDYITNKISTNHNQGIGMNEYLQKLIEALIVFLNENATPEIATQTQAFIDEYKQANPLPTAEPTAPTSNNAETQIPKEFAEKIEALEKENRYMKFNEYITEKTKEGKILPANANLVLNILEMAHTKGTANFSENGKTNETPAIELIKKFIDTVPKQIEFSEAKGEKEPNSLTFSENGFMVSDLGSLELHNKVLDFMEEQKKLNVILDYKTALLTVATGGK